MHEKHRIAYINKSLGPKQQLMHIYERLTRYMSCIDGLCLVWNRGHRGIAELMRFDFEIHYKKQVENVAIDVLSRNI